MGNKTVKPTLTEHQMLKYQRRLSCYLNDYEYKNNLQAKDVALKVDISPQKFSYLKSEKKPYGKFINSLDYLAKLARLEQMSIGEFIEYLEGQRDKNAELPVEKKIFNWQKTVLDSFEPLTSTVRATFIETCKSSLRDGKRKLELLLEIVNLLRDKDAEGLASLRDALKKIT